MSAPAVVTVAAPDACAVALAEPAVSKTSVYCILWCGFKGLRFVEDGLGVIETLADEPSCVFPTPRHLAQTTFDFEENSGGKNDV